MTTEARREVGEYLTEQPLGDEQISDDDLAVLLFIATFHYANQRVPRFHEIAEARGLSYVAAKQTVRRLRALGQVDGLYERPILIVVS